MPEQIDLLSQVEAEVVKSPARVIPLHLSWLQAITAGGLRSRTMSYFAAFPGMGKTGFFTQLSWNVSSATYGGVSVGIFPLEEGSRTQMMRFGSVATNCTKEEFEAQTHACGTLPMVFRFGLEHRAQTLYVYECDPVVKRVGLQQIERVISSVRRDMWIIDYARCIEGWTEAGAYGCARMLNELARMAHHHDTHIMLLTQLAPVARVEELREPRTWYTQDTRHFNQVSSLGIYMQRPMNGIPGEADDLAILYGKRNRLGPTGESEIYRVDGPTGTLWELDAQEKIKAWDRINPPPPEQKRKSRLKPKPVEQD